MKFYLRSLRKEAEDAAGRYEDREVRSIFFGGGTPSVYPEAEICALLGRLGELFAVSDDAEISIEVNPGTVSKDKLAAYRRAGINRLSIGCQSVHDEELRCLGRIHDHETFLKTYAAARSAGFSNINIDLMAALPGSSTESFGESLSETAKLGPEHISVYNLIIEEGTEFYERYADGRGLPDEDTEREMYHMTEKLLSEYGYARYEISNYARPGYECRHNLVYWERGDYLGLGLNAAGCVDNVRWKNTPDMDRYLKGGDIIEEREEADIEERCFESMMLGLRLIKGVDTEAFMREFGISPEEKYGKQIAEMKAAGLLTTGGGYIRLTERGLDVADAVILRFLD